MISYFVRRILLLIPTLFLVTIIVFLLVRLIPGDVVDLMLQELYGVSGGGGGGGISAGGVTIDREEVERRLGLDVPIHVQYGRWIGVAPAPDEKTGEPVYNGILQGCKVTR